MRWSEIVTNERKREELVRRGVEQARKFRWTETARETAALYCELVDHGA